MSPRMKSEGKKRIMETIEADRRERAHAISAGINRLTIEDKGKSLFRTICQTHFLSFHITAYGNLANVLTQQGRLGEAEAALQTALYHRPNMADAHYNL